MKTQKYFTHADVVAMLLDIMSTIENKEIIYRDASLACYDKDDLENWRYYMGKELSYYDACSVVKDVLHKADDYASITINKE